MKRIKKIRGHKRIWKEIENWVNYNKTLDLDYLKSRKRDYVKVWVSPFKNLSVLNSEFSPPKGKTRQKIIEGILEIFKNWETQLNSLDKSYYLKIWYFPHDVSKCQVVCAIDDFLNFYDITFYKPTIAKPFPDEDLDLQWEYHHQEHHVTIKDIGEPEDYYSLQDFIDNKKWVEAIMKNPKTRVTEYNDNGEKTIYYSIKDCDVWIGGR